MTRLAAICSLINDCEVLADIGCDHGLVSKFVLDNNLAKKVIATDISPKCLEKAKLLLSGYENAEFMCTDGLKGVSADTAVIAGMGGSAIIEIIKHSAQLSTSKPSSLVLQPQDCRYELRQFLSASGYKIDADFIVKENDKFYDIISATRLRRGEKGESLDEFQLYLGAFYLDKEGNPSSFILLKERLQREIEKFNSYNDGGKNDNKRAFLKEAYKSLEGR